jgi:hypothetical protein
MTWEAEYPTNRLPADEDYFAGCEPENHPQYDARQPNGFGAAQMPTSLLLSAPAGQDVRPLRAGMAFGRDYCG